MLPEQRWEGTEIKIKRHSNMCGSRELFLFLFSDLSDDIGHGRMRGEDQGGTTEGEKTLEIKMEGRARRMYPKEQSTPVGCVHFCTRVWRAAPHEQTELPDTLSLTPVQPQPGSVSGFSQSLFVTWAWSHSNSHMAQALASVPTVVHCCQVKDHTGEKLLQRREWTENVARVGYVPSPFRNAVNHSEFLSPSNGEPLTDIGRLSLKQRDFLLWGQEKGWRHKGELEPVMLIGQGNLRCRNPECV